MIYSNLADDESAFAGITAPSVVLFLSMSFDDEPTKLVDQAVPTMIALFRLGAQVRMLQLASCPLSVATIHSSRSSRYPRTRSSFLPIPRLSLAALSRPLGYGGMPAERIHLGYVNGSKKAGTRVVAARKHRRGIVYERYDKIIHR